jgi:hypothetical protein
MHYTAERAIKEVPSQYLSCGFSFGLAIEVENPVSAETGGEITAIIFLPQRASLQLETQAQLARPILSSRHRTLQLGSLMQPETHTTFPFQQCTASTGLPVVPVPQ